MRIVCRVFHPIAYQLYEADEHGNPVTKHGGADPGSLSGRRIVGSGEVFVNDNAEGLEQAKKILEHIQGVLATKQK